MSMDSGTAVAAETEAPATVVELPEADDEGEAPAAAADGKPSKWTERKRERRDLREENERLRADQAAANERVQRFEIELAELRGRVHSAPQAAQENGFEAKEKQLRKRANDVLSMVQEGKASMDDYYDTIGEMQDLRWEAKHAKNGGPAPMTAEQIEQTVTRRAMEAEFPWLPHNPQARRWADGAYDQLIAEGRPEGPATVKEALALASNKFGLGGARMAPVSDAQKRLYAGVSSRDTGGNGAVSVRMDERTRKLAEARWSDVSPKEAHTKMAELLRRKAKERGEI